MWDELGIAETMDLGAIRKAYAARLRTVNKSGDRQAFARLRAAFEQAVARAERGPTKTISCIPDPHAHIEMQDVAEPRETPEPEEEHQPDEKPPAGPVRIIRAPEDTSESETPRSEPGPVTIVMASEEEARREADELSLLLNRLQDHARQGDIAAAMTDYEQGLARGILPFDSHEMLLDQIMRRAIDTLDGDAFVALMQRVGWNDAIVGHVVSPLRTNALARLEAERWVAGLKAEADAPMKIWRTAPALLWKQLRQRRNARLLLTGTPQLYRLSIASLADLKAKLAGFRRFETWLKNRIAPAGVARAEKMLAFDKRWGKQARWTVLWAIPLGLLFLVGAAPAPLIQFLGALVLAYLGGQMVYLSIKGLQNLVLRVKARFTKR